VPRVASSALSSNQPTPTPTSTLSLHDALPISPHPEKRGPKPRRTSRKRTRNPQAPNRTSRPARAKRRPKVQRERPRERLSGAFQDRKSTRLNSSHQINSYAVFCLKKKKKTNNT